jgi:hypothetical protein
MCGPADPFLVEWNGSALTILIVNSDGVDESKDEHKPWLTSGTTVSRPNLAN